MFINVTHANCFYSENTKVDKNINTNLNLIMKINAINKKVYVECADILHHGHINILVIAHSKRDVTAIVN